MTRPTRMAWKPRRQRLAKRQEPVEAERLLVGGDLEHAVGGGVADRPAGFQMRRAELGHDLGARGVAVAEDALRSGQPADLGDEVVREGGVGIGEIGPVPGHRQAGELPVARGRVLAARRLRRRAPEPGRSAPSPGASAPLASRTAAPRPSASRCGSESGPLRPSSAAPRAQACATWATVLAPVSGTSPLKYSASGAPPMPTLSITTRKARVTARSSRGRAAAAPGARGRA